jgi:hypothetical protein
MTYSTEKILFKSGDLFLPLSIRKFLEIYWVGNDTSTFYINNWSIVHFLSGIVSVYLFDYFKVKQNKVLYAFLLHTIWELWQMIGKNTKYWTLRGQIDVITDTVFFMTGFLLRESFIVTK